MTDWGKKLYDLFARPLGSIPNSNSLAKFIKDSYTSVTQRGGVVYDALYTDAAGSSLADDIAAIDAYLIAGGDIHDVLYADAIGASLAVDIASINSVTKCGEATGTLSYLDAGAEQTILEQTVSTRRRIDIVWIDAVNMTQNGTIIFYHKIDASNYREFNRHEFIVATHSDGILINGFTINNDWKMSWTEGADEGAARNLPYNVIYQELE